MQPLTQSPAGAVVAMPLLVRRTQACQCHMFSEQALTTLTTPKQLLALGYQFVKIQNGVPVYQKKVASCPNCRPRLRVTFIEPTIALIAA